ncbi:MAG TPA: citramalate synthase [Oscillospiraceae bacterium]|nr:citramalate synthase [Oscillospiraceae bacterium]
MKKVFILDSTLRDGAQGEGINFSSQDKFNIMKALDEFGIDYIEAGNPASNPKDLEFFKMSSEYKFKNAKLVAFGSTRRKGMKAEEDENLNTLADCSAEYITIFGKSWDFHVTDIIRTTLEDNISMITESIEFLTKKGKKVFFDAEHFFDGYKNNSEYALSVLKAAEKAGADEIVLCDTNGGCFPDEIFEITKKVIESVNIPVGIHCHNDMECAVANSVSAVKAGASQVQGTFIGIGERCGNTNLSAIIPSLRLKLGYGCAAVSDLSSLTKTARYIAEVSNLVLADSKPYVGKSAFAHKGGMHVDGVRKNPKSFEHISPEDVGNQRNFLLSEVSGRTVILSKLASIAPELSKDSIETIQISDILKDMEFKGYQYEAAEASFELLVKKYLGKLKTYFDIDYFKIIGEKSGRTQTPSSAIVKVKVGDKTEIGADEGDGPVNAIDKALRSALKVFYPQIEKIHLIDYKVRVMDSNSATAAVVRVLIESTDGKDVWTTVGASSDIINASVIALVDSIEYKLLKDGV